MKLRWSNALVSGYKEIDEEHEELINLANELQDAIDRKYQETVIQTLRNFESEVREHFISEEKVMENNNYTLLEAHRKLHVNYLNLLEVMIHNYLTSKSLVDLSEQFKMACAELTRHIIHYDIPVLQKIQKQINLQISK